MSAARRTSRIGVLVLAMGVTGAQASPVPRDCAALADDTQRLACYDRAVGRNAAPSPAAAAETVPSSAPAGPGLTVVAAPVIDSPLSKLWELDPADKQGTFKLQPYKLNYLLPVRWTTRANSVPNSPGAANGLTTALPVQATEAKFQLSVKLKAVENMFGDNGDLWFGYTQQSSWQLYNNDESRPFRETAYAPEVMLAFRVDHEILGWRWRLLNLGFVHQSNGRAEPLSRSWNRVYAQFGFERGHFTVLAQPWYRLNESAATDDNPDIGDYMGSGTCASSTPGAATSIPRSVATASRAGAGGLELEWAFPLFGPLKGYLQATTGYGESLVDYNHSQTTVGLGVLLLPW